MTGGGTKRRQATLPLMAQDRAAEDHLGRQSPWLRRLAFAVVHDEWEAADLAQQTLVTALRQKRRPDAATGVRPWLRAIFQNVLRAHQRAWVRRTRRERVVDDLKAVEDPESQLGRLQLQRVIERSLEDLEEPFRSALVLRYRDGLSAAAIALQLGLPASTVRSRIAVGLRRIRDDIVEDGAGGQRRASWIVGLARLFRRATRIVPRAAVVGGVVLAGAPLALSSMEPKLVHGPAPRSARIEQVRRLGSPGPTRALQGPWAPPGLPLAGRHVGRETVVGTPGKLEGTAAEAMAPGCDGTADSGAAFSGDHPRLLVDRQRLCDLRARVGQPGTIARQIFDALRSRVDQDSPALFGTYRLNYARASLAQAAAFVYLVTGLPRYAAQAFENVASIYQDPGGEPTPEDGYALARAVSGAGLAFVYDWASSGLSEIQRDQLERWLVAAVQQWPSITDRRLLGVGQSYWVAACRSAEVLQRLALGEPRDAERLAALETILTSHVVSTYGDLGLSQEGPTYTSQAGTLLVPAALALRASGRNGLASAIESKAFWKGLMFQAAATDRPDPAWALSGGAGASRLSDEGWASLLFAVVPDEVRPYYRHFYDRHTGERALRPRSARFDPSGVGQVWALLFYPEHVSPRDPGTALGRSAADETRGAYLFRNGWSGTEDVLVSLAGDFRSTPRGRGVWNVAEAFQLKLFAHGTPFITGREGQDDRGRLSALLVDGRAYHDHADTGAPETHVGTEHGGYVIVDGGSKYRRLGLSRSRRHLLVDFSGRAGTALIATLDELRAPEPHVYAWQAALGDPARPGDIRVTTGVDGGRPSFLLRGRGDAFVKGWVLSPQATLKAGDTLRVMANGADVDLWIVMVTGFGAPPVAAVHGSGLEAVLAVGGARLRFDRTSGRLVLAEGI